MGVGDGREALAHLLGTDADGVGEVEVAVVVHEDVRLEVLEDGPELLLARVVGEVQGHRALPGVEDQVEGEGPVEARLALDGEHLGAELGEDARGAGPGDEDRLVAADAHAAQFDPAPRGAGAAAQLPADELVRGVDVQRFLDAGHRIQVGEIDPGLVADDADQRAVLAAADVRFEAQAPDFLDHVFNFGFGGFAAHDNHLCSSNFHGIKKTLRLGGSFSICITLADAGLSDEPLPGAGKAPVKLKIIDVN